MSSLIGSPIAKYGAMRKTAVAQAKAANTGKTICSVGERTSLATPMNAPSTKATSAPCHVGASSRASPVVSTAWPKVRTIHPCDGFIAPISFNRAMPSSGVISARPAASIRR